MLYFDGATLTFHNSRFMPQRLVGRSLSVQEAVSLNTKLTCMDIVCL